ncbi:MAG TPA: PRC-barrel domain-containing protein [Candidatus Saccharimonadales bacterium]|nr:PRC-barrel domain-containing protein [Candidatus Saccharimonadales bacterium]
MLLPIERFAGAPLISLQLETKIASLAEPIIDPRQLKLVAFYVDSPKAADQDMVIYTSDIREVNPRLGMIIDNDDVITPLDDLVRLHEIINFEFNLIGIKVVDERGRKYGKVTSYSLDPKSFFVEQLTVEPNILRSLGNASNLIHRNQIVSVTNKRIIIKAPTVKASQAAKQTGDFINPFREINKQPENSHYSSSKARRISS